MKVEFLRGNGVNILGRGFLSLFLSLLYVLVPLRFPFLQQQLLLIMWPLPGLLRPPSLYPQPPFFLVCWNMSYTLAHAQTPFSLLLRPPPPFPVFFLYKQQSNRGRVKSLFWTRSRFVPKRRTLATLCNANDSFPLCPIDLLRDVTPRRVNWPPSKWWMSPRFVSLFFN